MRERDIIVFAPGNSDWVTDPFGTDPPQTLGTGLVSARRENRPSPMTRAMNKLFLSALSTTVLTLGLGGCGASGNTADDSAAARLPNNGDEGASEAEGIPRLPAHLEQETLLPAFMTQEEKSADASRVRAFADHRSSPPSGNVSVPSEFGPTEGVVVRIPMDGDTQDFFGQMVREIARSGATPYLLVENSQEADLVDQYFLSPYGTSKSSVEFIYAYNDSFWSRDFGPYHVYVNGERSIVDMQYYSTRPNDDYVPVELGNAFNEDVYSAPLETEGGNFMTDGLGTCWASRGVLNANFMSESGVRAIYQNYLGCSVVKFVAPLPGEGTTHIDMFSKILDEDTILVAYSNSSLGANASQIRHLDNVARDYASTPKPDGGSWNIVRIPMVIDNAWEVFYAYTNSLIVNDTVVVPVYGYDLDSEALSAYRRAMPGYRVVGVDAQAVIPMGGSVHCTTMQVPKRYASAATRPSAAPGASTVRFSGTVGADDFITVGDQWFNASSGSFSVTMTGSGDADLYVWKDVSEPTWDNYACRPYLEGSQETCNLNGPGEFLVGVHGTASSNSYNVAVTYRQ